jgi:hypothetical protein
MKPEPAHIPAFTVVPPTRDDFREGVFERDGHKCVICKEPGKDAHHIIERRLWDNGGYYLYNGATLCEKHHIEAEMTTLTCEEIREKAGIPKVILPPHLYEEYRYDKWGNIILPTGMRLKGELFYDESVQKILAQGKVLDQFSKYVKYPRSMHLPWSEKISSDDRQLDLEECRANFEGKEVVVTVKMDGENTTMYDDHIHARSLDSGTHPSRSWVKGLWSRIAYQIPTDWRICGENLYAKHTIVYAGLDSFFYVFSWWNERNECLSWDETVAYSEMLGLKTVPVLYRGKWDENLIRDIYRESYEGNRMEGYVVRLAESFTYGAFRKSLAKFVSDKFQIDQTGKHGHWMRDVVTPNKLKEETEE